MLTLAGPQYHRDLTIATVSSHSLPLLMQQQTPTVVYNAVLLPCKTRFIQHSTVNSPGTPMATAAESYFYFGLMTAPHPRTQPWASSIQETQTPFTSQYSPAKPHEHLDSFLDWNLLPRGEEREDEAIEYCCEYDGN